MKLTTKLMDDRLWYVIDAASGRVVRPVGFEFKTLAELWIISNPLSA